AWLDIGCYGVSVARWLFDTEPVGVDVRMQRDPVFGTDRLTTALLEFPAGTATVTCSTQLAPHQSVAIHGTHGRIELELPFNPPTDQPTTIRLYRGRDVEEAIIDPCNQFVEQVDAFAVAVRHLAPPPVSLADSIANLVVLDHASRVFS
ncbi:MAG: Gfo/Idh/MocA family protein, partial [Gemmatimonadales bacterium]